MFKKNVSTEQQAQEKKHPVSFGRKAWGFVTKAFKVVVFLWRVVNFFEEGIYYLFDLLVGVFK